MLKSRAGTLVRYGSPPVRFLGRNGETKQIALLITAVDETLPRRTVVWLEPITSRKCVGSCRLEVPLLSLPDLIKELRKLQKLHAQKE